MGLAIQLFFSLLLTHVQPGKEPLSLIQTIPLPEVEGRIDHMAVDVKGNRLFICALGNNTLEVVDLKKGQRAVSLKGFHEPQGCAYLPEVDRIVVANGQSGGVAFLDGKTYKVAERIEPLDDADNVRYDSFHKRVLVGYGNGALAVIDSSTMKRIRDVKLPGHPESFQLRGMGDCYVNVPTAKQVCAANYIKSFAVHDSWGVTEAGGNFPMTMAAGRYVCIGCRKPPKLLFYDIGTAKLAGECAIPGDTDDIFTDRKTMRLYASCGEGYIAAVSGSVSSGLHVTKVPTAPGARTSLFVPELNRLYLAVPHRGSQRAEIRVYEPQP